MTIDLSKLLTEQRNPQTLDLDLFSAAEIAAAMNAEDRRVAEAVERELPQIALAMEAVAKAFRCGGRLFYIGAGTSGRLGVLDASECPPTFGVPHEMVIGLIAGGDEAIRKSAEHAEDKPYLAVAQLRDHDFASKDVLCGIAASGRTPYVLGGLEEARRCGAVSIGLCCVEASPFEELADIVIKPLTGAEVLTGSTRLKAGTAQKMVLNMLTTGAMVLVGKVYSNLMVDLVPSNAKLAERCRRIVVQATGCDDEEARAALQASGHNLKVAIMMLAEGLDETQAGELLRHRGERIRGGEGYDR